MHTFPQKLPLSWGLSFFGSLIPETKGRSLEDMDIIFGSVSAEQRQKNIEERENGSLLL